jgi:hypothetical protein
MALPRRTFLRQGALAAGAAWTAPVLRTTRVTGAVGSPGGHTSSTSTPSPPACPESCGPGTSTVFCHVPPEDPCACLPHVDGGCVCVSVDAPVRCVEENECTTDADCSAPYLCMAIRCGQPGVFGVCRPPCPHS